MSRIWLIPYASSWSYAFNARAVAHHLRDRFDIRIAYKGTPATKLRAWRPHLAVDFWWNGHARQLLPGVPILKQVSSHRWQQPRHGAKTAAMLVAKHLTGFAGVLTPSQRLNDELTKAGAPYPRIASKGFDPKLFGNADSRTGGLAVGWAGDARQPDKRVDLLREACPDLAVSDRSRSHEEMPDFYNAIDVITVASDAEGDPLTLIEGMACGCFPVVVDVGIVPELVRHGENGLIVERTPEAFRAAFEWCRENLDYVRAAGRRNAEQMLRTRTWERCALTWADAFDAALARIAS